MQTSTGTLLVSAARKALQVSTSSSSSSSSSSSHPPTYPPIQKQTDCAFVNAGNIRGNTAFPLDKTHFTYKDLKVPTQSTHPPAQSIAANLPLLLSNHPPTDPPTHPPTGQAEVPFPCELVVVHATGAVLSSLLQFSRRFSLLDPPVEKGGYLQVSSTTHPLPHSPTTHPPTSFPQNKHRWTTASTPTQPPTPSPTSTTSPSSQPNSTP